jgi:hypothetical protein
MSVLSKLSLNVAGHISCCGVVTGVEGYSTMVRWQECSSWLVHNPILGAYTGHTGDNIYLCFPPSSDPPSKSITAKTISTVKKAITDANR